MRTSDSTHSRYIRRTSVPDANPNHTSGKVASGATVYFELGGQGDEITSVMLRWFDATTSGTFTLQSTNAPFPEVTSTSTTASDWFEEGATITNPGGTAVGCFMLHLGNSGAKRLRLKYVAAADSELDIIPSGVE
jgi:hypothetical protein